MAYKIIEHNAKEKVNKGTYTSAQKVCDFIQKEYSIKTTKKDLLYAISQNYGEAWLYPFWGCIEVKKI